MSILLNILFIVALFVTVIALAPVCIKYIFDKVPMIKWIPLIACIGLIALQFFVPFGNMFITYGVSVLAGLLFFWFMHLHQTGGVKKKEKPIVIKPKAKPNRVKNIQKNNGK